MTSDATYTFQCNQGHKQGNSRKGSFVPKKRVLKEGQCIKAGMSNVRPAGRMRPAKGLNAAREKIFLYVMHVARERI